VGFARSVIVETASVGSMGGSRQISGTLRIVALRER
jgi:hypothetical protein